MQHNQSSRLQALAASAPPSKSPGCVQGSSHTSKGRRRAGKLCHGPHTPGAQLQVAGKI